MTYYDKVQDYFNGKADAYDDVDQQLYWVFSDLFYKEVLKKELGSWVKEKKNIHLLDAGAGTGRWTYFFHELFNKDAQITGTLIDISEKMIDVAREKMNKYNGAFACLHGNIEDMRDISDNSFDISLSFYNVLSFVDNPSIAVKQIYNKLKTGGYHLAVVGNTYHAYYFSLLTKRPEQLANVRDNSLIRFNDSMPDMKCFTPQELRELYTAAGFTDVSVVGGPNFLYPGMEETFVHGATDSLQNMLKESGSMNDLLEIELKHYRDQDIAGRSNTLLVIAKK